MRSNDGTRLEPVFYCSSHVGGQPALSWCYARGSVLQIWVSGHYSVTYMMPLAVLYCRYQQTLLQLFVVSGDCFRKHEYTLLRDNCCGSNVFRESLFHGAMDPFVCRRRIAKPRNCRHRCRNYIGAAPWHLCRHQRLIKPPMY